MLGSTAASPNPSSHHGCVPLGGIAVPVTCRGYPTGRIVKLDALPVACDCLQSHCRLTRPLSPAPTPTPTAAGPHLFGALYHKGPASELLQQPVSQRRVLPCGAEAGSGRGWGQDRSDIATTLMQVPLPTTSNQLCSAAFWQPLFGGPVRRLVTTPARTGSHPTQRMLSPRQEAQGPQEASHAIACGC